MPRFYTPNEIRDHCFEDDAYVTVNGNVIDLTPLLRLYLKASGGDAAGDEYALLVKSLLQVAGKDISHWFDPTTGDLKKCIDPVTGLEVYATPYTGRFLHVPTMYPDSKIDWSYCNPAPGASTGVDSDTTSSARCSMQPWWLDPQYIIGQLTSKTRRIKIVNTLTHDETMLEVCAEEKLKDIINNRFVLVNAHAWSYTWKRLTDKDTWVLDPEKTLEENGIHDESDEFEQMGLNADYYVPSIHLYYNDDLTVA